MTTARVVIDGFGGDVVLPADDAYDSARQSFNGLLDRRPAIIARPRSAADVGLALAHAREAGLEVSVRGGGHSVAGHSMVDGGLVIDLSLMRDVVVDRSSRVARAGGGVLWMELDAATQAHRLATPGGTFGDTGIAGLTLGGGIGWLLGTAGLTCDNLVAAEVVTADGRVVRAAEDGSGDAELLWGLRGGGGNFGVVTSFEYRLHPVDGVVGGALLHRAADAADALRRFRDISLDGPDELTAMPEIVMVEGELMLETPVCVSRPDGADLLEPLRRGSVVEDTVGLRTYAEQQAMGQAPFGLRHYWSGAFLDDLDDGTIGLALEAFRSYPGTRGSVLFEPIHGEATRVPDDSAAFPHRWARFQVTAVTVWEDPGADERCIAWARSLSGELRARSRTGAGYLNYSTGDESVDRVRATFGAERYERLAQLKARYDPDNVFRSNHNIVPAGSGS